MKSFPSSHRAALAAFTLIELLVTITIVVVLMGLSLGIQGYASNKSLRTRAEVEIRALAAACESYKTDQADYPRTTHSESLSSYSSNAALYIQASAGLYMQLSGDTLMVGRSDVSQGRIPDGKQQSDPVYLEFKPSQLKKDESKARVLYIRDPWDSRGGKVSPYGYSTRRNTLKNDESAGHNATYDLWSMAGKQDNPNAWISNW